MLHKTEALLAAVCDATSDGNPRTFDDIYADVRHQLLPEYGTITPAEVRDALTSLYMRGDVARSDLNTYRAARQWTEGEVVEMAELSILKTLSDAADHPLESLREGMAAEVGIPVVVPYRVCMAALARLQLVGLVAKARGEYYFGTKQDVAHEVFKFYDALQTKYGI